MSKEGFLLLHDEGRRSHIYYCVLGEGKLQFYTRRDRGVMVREVALSRSRLKVRGIPDADGRDCPYSFGAAAALAHPRRPHPRLQDAHAARHERAHVGRAQGLGQRHPRLAAQLLGRAAAQGAGARARRARGLLRDAVQGADHGAAELRARGLDAQARRRPPEDEEATAESHGGGRSCCGGAQGALWAGAGGEEGGQQSEQEAEGEGRHILAAADGTERVHVRAEPADGVTGVGRRRKWFW